MKVFCSSAMGYKRVRMMFLISSQNINVVTWSPCGQYIAAGGVDGHVTVWDAGSQKAHQRSEVIRNHVLTAHCSKKRGENLIYPSYPSPSVPWFIPCTPPPLSPVYPSYPSPSVPWYIPRTPLPLSTYRPRNKSFWCIHSPHPHSSLLTPHPTPHSSLLIPQSSPLSLTPHSSLLTPHSSSLTVPHPSPSLLTPHSSPLILHPQLLQVQE